MTFSAASLYAHVSTISKEVGPRLATSVTERSMAYYIETCLQRYGLQSLRQNFNTLERYSKRLMPQIVLSAAATGMSLIPNKRWGWLTGLFGVGLFWHGQRILRGAPAAWEHIFTDAVSQNVICRIPSRDEVRQRVILSAHLDTSFHRLSFHPKLLPVLSALLAGVEIGTLSGSLLSLYRGENEWSKQVRMAVAMYLMVGSLTVALDEFTTPVQGANDNASGIGVLLGLAELLAQEPLQHTEVWMVFTGSEEVGGAGMEAFLYEFAPELRDSWCIVLNTVGAGDLCWISDHSLSAATHYKPHPDAEAWAERVARRHPEWGVMGRDLTTLDEVAIANRYGLRGIRLTGLDRLSGYVPNQHRVTDTLDHIDACTLQKAADFTLAMLRDLDMQ